MATKIVCDGCDQELLDESRTLRAEWRCHVAHADLCETCFEKIGGIICHPEILTKSAREKFVAVTAGESGDPCQS